jgi:hypothetical protein
MVGRGIRATSLIILYVKPDVAMHESASAVRPYRKGQFVRLVWRKSTSRSKNIEHIPAALRSVARTRFSDLVVVEEPQSLRRGYNCERSGIRPIIARCWGNDTDCEVDHF